MGSASFEVSKRLRPRWLGVVEGLREHRRVARAVVAHVDSPRLTAHLTILDVLLPRAASWIERHGVGFSAVRAHHGAIGVRGAVTERELLVEIVVLKIDHVPESTVGASGTAQAAWGHAACAFPRNCLHRRECLVSADANAQMNAPSRPSARITSSSSRASATA